MHPAIAYQQAIIANLPAKTGRSLAEWLAAAKRAPAPKEKKALGAWLKAQGLGGTQAMIVLERLLAPGDRHAFQEDTPEGYLQAAEGYVDAMFAGKKAALRPLYDRLLKAGLGLGKDVKACPCKTKVPLYREHVFAELTPSTQTRLDLGLALGALRGKGRLVETGGFARKDRITHRLEVKSLADLDEALLGWLRKAYALDAPA